MTTLSLIILFVAISILAIGICGASFCLGYIVHKRELIKFTRRVVIKNNDKALLLVVESLMEKGKILEGRIEVTHELLNFMGAKKYEEIK